MLAFSARLIRSRDLSNSALAAASPASAASSLAAASAATALSSAERLRAVVHVSDLKMSHWKRNSLALA